MKKRLFSILLVLALICSLLPQTALTARAEGAPVFEDVPEDAYYKDSVDWALERGITSGTSATTFSPNKICTRAEIVTFLWAAADRPIVEIENPFADVSENKYYYHPVLWAYANGISSGVSETSFGARSACSRADAVTFLWVYAGRPIVEIENPFDDISENQYFYNAVLWAYANGITSGTSESTFGPAQSCTRAQIITFLFKALGAGEAPDERLNEYGLAKIVEDGTILHAWCWNFNTIKAMIPQIAAAGFSSVQTSPINSIIVGENGGLQIVGQGKWYYHYQPTEYEVIGNYQLGTDQEFREMCEVAHAYGVKIIVDQVVNHMTATESAISNKIRNEIDWGEPGEWGNPSKPWTHKSTGTNWSERDRFEETQNSLSGLIEWNTQNPRVQAYILNWLQTCVEAGADGFRFDAAKLIELPDDVSIYHPDYHFASDFWPTVLQNGASFQYGEALQEGEPNHRWQDVPNVVSGYNDEDSSRLHAYQDQIFLTQDGEEKHFNTTLSFYGWRLRDAIHNGNLNAAYVGDMLVPEGASADRTVTWVESHDNYINDHSYNELDEQQVIQAWAILAARKEGTPLFFSRPMNATASSPYGNNLIGPEGSHFFMDSQVVAVNFFRNEMGSAEEYVSNPTGTNDVVMIERGDKGAVIVNVRNEDIVLDNVPVQSMADGSYTEQVYGGTFTVSGGKLSGTLRAGKVAVVYNSKLEGRLDFEPEITLSVPTSEFITDTLEVTISMRGVASANYTVNDGEPVEAVNGTVVSIGEGMENNDTATLVVTGFNAEGEQVAQVSATYTKRGYRADTMVYVDDAVRVQRGWGNATVHVYLWGNNGTNNGSWPGVAAQLQTEGSWAGYWKYVLPFELENEAEMHVIINNGSGGGNNQIERGDMLIHPGEIKVMNADEEWEDGSGDYHPHQWDEGVTVAEPSCTENGTIVYTCVICGSTKTESIPALGHDWNEGEQTLAPSCTADGAWTYTCLRCAETRDDPIDALGHEYGEDGICVRCGEPDPNVGKTGFVQATLKPAAEDQVIIAVETEDGFFAFRPYDYNRNPATGVPITVEDRVVVNPDPALVWTVAEGSNGGFSGLVLRSGSANLRFNSNRIRLQNNLGNGIFAAVNYGDAFKLRNEALKNFLGYADGAFVIASDAYPVYFFTWKEAPGSEAIVYAEPGTSSFDETLDVVLHASPELDHAAYRLGEGSETAFADGDVITIGADMAADESVTLLLTGYDAEDAVLVTAEYSYTKRAPLAETTVYVEDGYQGWDAYAVHAWNAPTDELSEGQITTAWPGVVSELQTEGDWTGYWKSVLPAEFEGLELIKIIINNNGNGSQQDAGTMAWGETKVMTKDGEWLNPEDLPTEPELPNFPDPEGPLTWDGLAKEVSGGSILHTWCWSFNTIREMIPEIAAAGFSAVQTSPINEIKVGDNGGLSLMSPDGDNGTGKWWWNYQPTNYNDIGNYQLGTEEEFKAMVETAHAYGVKVIVDQVINHTTSDYEAVAPEIKGRDWGTEVGNYPFSDDPTDGWRHRDVGWANSPRLNSTVGWLSGLIDWNTQNPQVQQYLLQWLQYCVEAGADGFRFDAAHHIELPTDSEDIRSDFWPIALQNGASFQYGEVLSSGLVSSYQALTFEYNDETRHFGTTNASYGSTLRSRVSGRNLSVNNITNMGTGAENSVTWVESHDNYCNESSYNTLNEQQVIQAWAILSARKNGTPLFYSRPNNSSASNPWGDNLVGPAGSPFYMDPQVVAANFFRIDMEGLDEYLSNPGGNATLMIERGDLGAVIVNAGTTDLVLEGVASHMADGSYTDQVYGGEFEVVDGKISGVVSAGKVAVVYEPEVEGRLSLKPGITFSVPDGTEFIDETLSVTVGYRGLDHAVYQIDDGEAQPLRNGGVVILGEDVETGSSTKLSVIGYNGADEEIIRKEASYFKKAFNGTVVYMSSTDAQVRGWSQVYVYTWGPGSNASWPGVKMELQENGFYRYALPANLERQNGHNVIFNNGSGGGTNQFDAGQLAAGEHRVWTADRQWILYDESMTDLSSTVFATPGDTVFTTDTLAITLNVLGCDHAAYQLDDGELTPYSNGAVITVGADMDSGDVVILKLFGYNAAGEQIADAENSYTKTVYENATTIYIDPEVRPDWTNFCIYVYASDGDHGHGWPGVQQAELEAEDGLLKWVLPADLQGLTLTVIFSNGGSNQVEQGWTIGPDQQKIWRADGSANGVWEDYIPG